MSKMVQQVINDIKEHPEEWKPYINDWGVHYGISCGKVLIDEWGNGRVLSNIEIAVNGSTVPISHSDKWKLEVAVTKWYNGVDLRVLIGGK